MSPEEEAKSNEDEDIIAVLHRGHGEAFALLAEIESTAGIEAGGSAEDAARRISMVDLLVTMLSAHEAAEEEILWPAVADAIDGGPSIARLARAHEREGKVALDDLRRAERKDARTFEMRVQRVAALVREHVAFEEEVLEKVAEEIPELSRRSLGQRIDEAIRRGPTRPHPHAPTSAGMLHVAGPLVAATDRLRDLVRRRPAGDLDPGVVSTLRTTAVELALLRAEPGHDDGHRTPPRPSLAPGDKAGGARAVPVGHPHDRPIERSPSDFTPSTSIFSNGQVPAESSGYEDPPPRMGFFTDTSVCIGCKACEVVCKEWNHVPEDGLDFSAMSYDNTKSLGADSWRHVAFIEQRKPLAMQMTGPSERPGTDGEPRLRWLMSSDVCKHCTEAACLDVCPTGAIIRTEFGTVVVQEDVCNGCGYCVPACPYGVLDRRDGDGRVWKCTLCYDRLSVGEQPACAKACPTDSIQFGPLDELRQRADDRLARLHQLGVADARLYGHDPHDGIGGDGAFFLLLDEPEVYGLPPDPVVTTRDLPAMWTHAAVAAAALVAVVAAAFVGGRR